MGSGSDWLEGGEGKTALAGKALGFIGRRFGPAAKESAATEENSAAVNSAAKSVVAANSVVAELVVETLGRNRTVSPIARTGISTSTTDHFFTFLFHSRSPSFTHKSSNTKPLSLKHLVYCPFS